jgi:hypothetical protein
MDGRLPDVDRIDERELATRLLPAANRDAPRQWR